MINARQNDSPFVRFVITYLANLSDAEFLNEIAAVSGGGGPVGYLVRGRLLRIAARCDAIEEASE